MAQIAAGLLRLAVRGPGGRVVTWGDEIEYDILDNTAAPLVYVPDRLEGLKYGTINDYFWNIPKDFVVVGAAGHFLEVQYWDASERTPATANHTVVMNVAELFYDPVAKENRIMNRPIRIADRVTKDTSGTATDVDGLKDNTKTTPSEWSPLTRHRPGFGKNWVPRGRQRFVVDGT